jgi:DNA-binding response OmpR family regulator
MNERPGEDRNRVLIIEDDTTARETFRQILVDLGYVVCAVPTAGAGLAEISARPPDAVVLDLHLPIIDGLECLRSLRAAPLQSAVPVAILTGDYFIDEDVAHELQGLGARIHFKPVWDEDLRRIVEDLVSQQHSS